MISKNYKKVAIIDLGTTNYKFEHIHDIRYEIEMPKNKSFEIYIRNVGFTPKKIFVNVYISPYADDKMPYMCELNKTYKENYSTFSFNLSKDKIILNSELDTQGNMRVERTYLITRIIAIS